MHKGQTSMIFPARAMALEWDEARMAALENLPVPGKGLCSCCLWVGGGCCPGVPLE